MHSVFVDDPQDLEELLDFLRNCCVPDQMLESWK